MMSPHELKKAGYKVLINELGISGMLRFLAQFDVGEGDYTKERKDILKDTSFSEILEFVDENK